MIFTKNQIIVDNEGSKWQLLEDVNSYFEGRWTSRDGKLFYSKPYPGIGLIQVEARHVI